MPVVMAVYLLTNVSYFTAMSKDELLASSTVVLYIYIFIAIACDETSILVAVHFSMKNIYQSCDLGLAVERNNVDVSQ